ncbi:MAG: F0F1 ATP synthase subunit A, partial [Gemmatimonadales bacterium]
MTQKPDIGGMILHHTADSDVLELPILGEIHLPTGWYVFGIDVSPTKHVVFMLVAAILVFLTMIVAARQVRRRQVEGRAPRGFGGAVEAMILFVRNDVAIANIGHGGEKFAPY